MPSERLRTLSLSVIALSCWSHSIALEYWVRGIKTRQKFHMDRGTTCTGSQIKPRILEPKGNVTSLPFFSQCYFDHLKFMFVLVTHRKLLRFNQCIFFCIQDLVNGIYFVKFYSMF